MLLHWGVVSIARRGGKSIFHAALDPMVARVDKAKRNIFVLQNIKWQNYDPLTTWQVVEYRATNKPKHFFITYFQIWWKMLAKLLHLMWFISALSWYCWAIMNVWNVIYHFEDGWWPGYKYSSCCFCCWCNRKIYYQPRPHFNGHWKMPASFNTNLRSATFLQKPKMCIVKALAELTFHFSTAHYIFLLHVFPDVRSIWGCSECLLQLRAQSSAETPTH